MSEAVKDLQICGNKGAWPICAVGCRCHVDKHEDIPGTTLCIWPPGINDSDFTLANQELHRMADNENEKAPQRANVDTQHVKESTDIEASSIALTSIEPKREARLLAKLDIFFVPIIMLVYLSCFLDRANIGNVKVAGMQSDIHASTEEFSTAVSIFYATYVLSETPWAVLLKKLTPRLLLTCLAIVWSLVTVFSGFIHNIGGLYATRLILGACEGGLFPGLTLYLSMVYKRSEQAKRISYLFVCTAIAGAFGGLLAYAILHMDGVSGVAGWRWVYIIEGIFSIAVAAIVFFGLPNDPDNAYFLTASERDLMKVRAAQRAAYMGSEEFSWAEVRTALTDPKVYLSGVIQFCQDILLYGFSTFLPSIIKGMGYGTYQTQYLTVPVYFLGGSIFLCVAWLSDRLRLRSPFLLPTNVFGIMGYILLLIPSLPIGAKFFATFMCAIAVYTGPGLNITWLSVNQYVQNACCTSE